MEERRAILEQVFTAPDAASLKESLGQLPSSYLVLDRSAPGPVEPVHQLVASGDLKEVFHAGNFSVLVETHRAASEK